MKTLSAFIKTKFILVALLSISSVVIATRISRDLDKQNDNSIDETNESNEIKKTNTPTHTSKTDAVVFAASITQVMPRAGTVSGGTVVTISGAGFTPPNAVYTVSFNGVAATSVVRVSNSVITAVTPAHAAGTVSVTVGINGVETTVDNLFTYVCDNPSNLIFSESMGTVPPGPPVSIVSHEAANGFDNDIYTMSGTGEVRASTASGGYPGASGGANVFLTNIFGRDFQIEGINTSSYPNLQISFGIFKSLAASDGIDLNIEVSADGVNYQALDFAPLPIGASSTGWHYRIAGGPAVPITPNLRIRFRQNGSTTQYRIDDVRLISSPPVTTQPASIVRCLGSSATFTVTASGNNLTYQWRKNNIDINGATTDSYTIPSVTNNDAGSYDVLITETCSGIITISNVAELLIDKTPPVVMVTGPVVNLGCNPSTGAIAAALGSASASDNCGTPTLTQSDGPVQSTGCLRSQVRTFTAIDNTGHSTSSTRTVIWTADLTPPAFFGSYVPLQLGCNPSVGAITTALGSASASDACSRPTIINSDGAVFTSGCSRTQTRTFTAIDACGNFSTISRSVSWIIDITPPVFIGDYSMVVLGCNPAGAAITGALGLATASDACSSPTLTAADGPVVTNGCNRTQTRVFRATDACGNTSTASRTVIWIVDITPPEFIGNYVPITLLSCNPSFNVILDLLGTATATDACSSPTITVTDGPLILGCNSFMTRRFTAVDACGNMSSVMRMVSWTVDVTPPTLSIGSATVNLGCNPTVNAIESILGNATATDACSVPTFLVSTSAVTGNGCNRSQTRTFIAADGCGNSSVVIRTANWIADVTPPLLTITGGPTDLGCNPAPTEITSSLGVATASDACSTVTVSIADGAIVSDGCDRSQTRVFIARDACGNITSASRTVIWTVDVTPPTLSIGSATVNLGCNPTINAIEAVLGNATATDACSAPIFLVSTSAVTVNGCNRSQTRTFIAADGCGNSSVVIRTANWIADATPPLLTISGGPTDLGCNPAPTEITSGLGAATASDACSTVTVSITDGAIVSNGCDRSQTRVFIARDACSNITSASRTVIWTVDVTPPTLSIGSATVNLGCNPTVNAIEAVLGNATATDACSAPILLVSTSAVTVNGCNRSQTRTFIAADGCGNSSVVIRTANWIADATPPLLTISGGPTDLGCNPAPTEITSGLGIATASDACSTVTVSIADGAVVSDGCDRSQTRVFIAKDACGNITSASRTVIWTVDVTPPTLSIASATINLGCNPDQVVLNTALGVATASDNCGAPTLLVSTGAVTVNGCNRSQTRTFIAADECGNNSVVIRTANWIADITPPLLTINGGPTDLGCNPAPTEITSGLGVATASDACSTVTVSIADGAVVSNGCDRSQTRVFIARDGCGNTTTASRTVTWTSDLIPPTLNISSATINLGCNPDQVVLNTALGVATATDNCGAPTLLVSTGAVTVNGCNRSQTRAFIAADECGNNSVVIRTANWIADATTPLLTISGGPTDLGCNPAPTVITSGLGVATASDACSTVTLTTVDGAVVSNGCDRSQTRVFIARDGCGNTTTASRTVTWTSDLIPPTLNISSATINLGCNPDAVVLNTALGVATASDNCGSPTLLVSTGAVTVNGCNRSQTRTFIAADECGNSAVVIRTANWIADVTSPVFIGNYSTVVLGPNPTATEISAALDGATASDACGAPTLVSSDGPVISNGCDRSQTRTFTARDACGNTAAISRTVTWSCGQTRINPVFTKTSGTRPFNVKAYPNPTEHQFTLYLEGATNGKVSITIYDAIGKMVRKMERVDPFAPISFGEDLIAGVYMVEVRQGENRRSLKLIKQ